MRADAAKLRRMKHKVKPAGGPEFTAALVVAAPVSAAIAQKPEVIRLPKAGTLCAFTGLSRTKLWEILCTRKVKTVCLRRPGALKGARLVHLQSLLDYLHSLAEGGV